MSGKNTDTIYGSAILGDNLWYVNYYGNLLCCFSLIDNKILRIEDIPYDGKNAEAVFSNIFVIGMDTLVIVPANTFQISIYHISKRCFEIIPIDLPRNRWNFFSGVVRQEKALFFVPYNFDKVLRYSLIDNTFSFIENDKLQLKEGFQYNYIKLEESIYFLTKNSNCVMAFNTITEDVETYYVGDLDCIFSALSVSACGNLIIIDQDAYIYFLNPKNREWKRVEDHVAVEITKQSIVNKSFSDCVSVENFHYFFPADSDKVLRFDEKAESICSLFEFTQEESSNVEKLQHSFPRCSLVTKRNNEIYGFYMPTHQLFRFNTVNNSFLLFDTFIELSKEERMYILNKRTKRNIINESNEIHESLSSFLEYIADVIE